MKLLCAVMAVGLLIFAAVKLRSWGPQAPPAEKPNVIHSKCHRHVKDLLQTRQGALEGQNNLMQEWQGALQGQNKPAQKWEEALQITTVVVSHLRANLKSVKDIAEKMSNQIRSWRSATGGSTTEYLETMARVIVMSENLATDFEGWCETQLTTLNAVAKRLDQKVRFTTTGNAVNITIENKLLQRIMKKGLEGLEDMEAKLEGLQADLNEMPTVALHMGVETCEKGGSSKDWDWETGFTEQVAAAHDLKRRCSFLVARVSKDNINMRDVTDHLDIGNGIEDAAPFQAHVLPQLKHLLNILDDHGENSDTV